MSCTRETSITDFTVIICHFVAFFIGQKKHLDDTRLFDFVFPGEIKKINNPQ